MSAPIVHRPAGVQPWLDEERTPSFRMPWRLLMIVVLLLSSCCGAGAFGVSTLLSNHARQSEAAAVGVTASATATDSPTMTPTGTAEASATPTASFTESPSALDTPSMVEDRSAYDRFYSILWSYKEEAREFPYPPEETEATIDLGPTYTLTPTAPAAGGGGERIVYVDRPGKDQIVYRDRLVTSAPQIIVNEVFVTVPPDIVYVVVTATPTPTFTATITPTLINPEQTAEPIDPERTVEPTSEFMIPEPTVSFEYPELLPLPPPPGYRR